MTPNELKDKIRSCNCKKCQAICALTEKAGADLRFSPKAAGRLCELAVVAAAGTGGIEGNKIPFERRKYAKHLGVELQGLISNMDWPGHIDWALKNSNHNPNAKNRINIGSAEAIHRGTKYYLLWMYSKKSLLDKGSS